LAALVDNAVALVQAYLRVNGYFTVAEYPILEAMRTGYRTLTDIDILGVRFPHAGQLVSSAGGRDEDHYDPDPVLGATGHGGDMIIGEVKERRAVLNAAATDPGVLRAVLVRFGCCPPAGADAVVTALIRDGSVQLPVGHQARLVAFGSSVDSAAGGRYLSVELGHVVRSLQKYLRKHWSVIRHSDHKDPALGFLVTLEKALGAE
jgi:hypothetical protein